MTDPLPPVALSSERAVLAACLWSPEAFHDAQRLLSDDDWYNRHHGDLWAIMRKLDAAGVTVDSQSVVVEALKLGNDHAHLVTDLATAGPVGAVAWHCEQIQQAATGRALLQALRRGLQKADSDRNPVELAEETIEALRLVQRLGGDAERREIDVHDLVARGDDPAEWIVEGLIARTERLIVTAPEGYGKSTLLRQVAMCVAAGVHPFRPQDGIEPRRVFVFDAENPQKINTTEYRRMWQFLEAIGMPPKRGQLHVEEVGPSNLLDARQASHLYAQIERLRPDIVLIGPLYQLHEENPNDEGPAKKLAAVLDRARMICGSALIIEAHTPHSDGPHGQLFRPYGASLWKRWPEFGYCLHPAQGSEQKASGEAGYVARMLRESEFTPWRGDRGDKRHWPMSLCAGARLPWEEPR